MDEDGDWFIIDRVKELIKYNAFQVTYEEDEGARGEGEKKRERGEKRKGSERRERQRTGELMVIEGGPSRA